MDDRHASKGIYILPNLFTTAALFAGFYAIVRSMNGHFQTACAAIFVAMVMDSMDGRIARLTHTESEFGAQYDSLSDMVSFGIAPALVIYEWSLTAMGKLGWLAAFIYAAAAALRLARFNTQLSDHRSAFQGLPSPAAAGLVTGLVWALHNYGVAGREMGVLGLIVTALAGGAMVSNIRYNSFKQIDLKGRVPFMAVLVIVLLFVLISLDPSRILFTIFLAYALSGPVLAVIRRHHGAHDDDDEEEEMPESR